ncbi:S1 family peptidase [Vibrio ezurae]|uniref:Putative peptidase n=1 Tax=Vibrio ezurae NBRC 102218 TaxID=1219080 RepID=U3CT32_9VIBR|nr:serine protease [Vibrio ezurae]GAD80833.1 putative peptidase [Vibrio ezurae NBRC 102218]
MYKSCQIAICTAIALGPVPASFAQGVASTYIVNGTPISVQMYPSFASLYFDQLDTSGLHQNYCGGTILDQYHVLTAAHCVEGDSYYYTYTSVAPQLQNEQQIIARVGTLPKVELIRASEFYYPSTFIDSANLSWPDDIAIIKLEQPMPVSSSDYTQLASLADANVYNVVGTEMLSIGHGYTRSDTGNDNILQGITQRILSSSACESANISSKQLCLQGDVDIDSQLRNSTCGGDSGGPLFWYNGTQYIQVGITSYGPSQCGDPSADYSSAYTEVAEYRDWIDSVLAGREVPKTIVTEFDRENYTPEEEADILAEESGGSLSWMWLFTLLIGHKLRSHRA